MDLRNLSEEQNRELPLGEERGNAFDSSSRRCRWASSPTPDSTHNQKHSNTALVSTLTTTTATSTTTTTNTPPLLKTDQHQSKRAPSFPNSVINLLDVSSSNGSQNQVHSSDDEDDGGDDQDDESDSTECSSSDNEENVGDGASSSSSSSTSLAIEAFGESTSQVPRTREPLHVINPKVGKGYENVTARRGDLRAASWPHNRPLPYPSWDQREPQVVHFKDILEYEAFAGSVEHISQQTVATHKYNTVGNYIRFYQEFKGSGEDSLQSFFHTYDPPITPQHYTCVGLAMELIARINSFLTPDHRAHSKFYIVSAEESIESVESYIRNVPPDVTLVEKEHVAVCLRIKIGMGIGTERSGYLLLDPGYHVSRVVTIMEDKLYPHTGCFVQEDTGKKKKEYEYIVTSADYVSWNVTETKSDYRSGWTNLLFVGRPFLSGVDFAERRNLLYDFKSILQRDSKGRLLAGMYFSTNPKKAKKVTLFYMENNNPVYKYLNMVKEFSDSKELQLCEEQMNMKKGELLQSLNLIGMIINDEDFITQSTKINKEIWNISRDN